MQNHGLEKMLIGGSDVREEKRTKQMQQYVFFFHMLG